MKMKKRLRLKKSVKHNIKEGFMFIYTTLGWAILVVSMIRGGF